MNSPSQPLLESTESRHSQWGVAGILIALYFNMQLLPLSAVKLFHDISPSTFLALVSYPIRRIDWKNVKDDLQHNTFIVLSSMFTQHYYNFVF